MSGQVENNNNRNIKRHCFRCNNMIYLHPQVRKKSDTTKLQAMDQEFDPVSKVVIPHVCVTEPEQKKYNYEEDRLPNPDEVYAPIKPVYDKKPEIVAQEPSRQRLNVSEVTPLSKQMLKDIEFIKSEISDIKMLLQAVIKIFDLATRKSNKQGDSLLFQKASNMVEEERTKIEETKKVTSETDDVDDDDGNVPEESAETLTEEEEEDKDKVATEEP